MDFSLMLVFSFGFLLVGAVTDYFQFKPSFRSVLLIHLPANLLAVLLAALLSIMVFELKFIFVAVVFKPVLFHTFKAYYQDTPKEDGQPAELS